MITSSKNKMPHRTLSLPHTICTIGHWTYPHPISCAPSHCIASTSYLTLTLILIIRVLTRRRGHYNDSSIGITIFFGIVHLPRHLPRHLPSSPLLPLSLPRLLTLSLPPSLTATLPTNCNQWCAGVGSGMGWWSWWSWRNSISFSFAFSISPGFRPFPAFLLFTCNLSVYFSSSPPWLVFWPLFSPHLLSLLELSWAELRFVSRLPVPCRCRCYGGRWSVVGCCGVGSAWKLRNRRSSMSWVVEL